MDIEEAAIELNYDFTFEDVKTYVEDHRIYCRKNPSYVRKYHRDFLASSYTSFIVVPALCFAAVAILSNDLSLALLVLFVSLIAWSPLLSIITRFRSGRRLRVHPGFVGKHLMRINAEGVTDRNTSLAWTIFWPHITNIDVGKNHIMFFLDKKAGGGVFPLPRRVFTNAQEAKSFVEK